MVGRQGVVWTGGVFVCVCVCVCVYVVRMCMLSPVYMCVCTLHTYVTPSLTHFPTSTLTPLQAAHCCLHIAGLVAECLKIQKEYPEGCAAFRHISPNIELEESGIREDKGAHGMDDRRYNDVGREKERKGGRK